jgi:hypothetical protein
MQKKARKISIIGLIIIVFIAKELAWVWLVQPFKGPDELAHYRYVQTLFHEQQLPVLGKTLYREGNKNRVEYTRDGKRFGITTDSITIEGPLEPEPGYLVNWIAQHPPFYYLILMPVYGLLQNQNSVLIITIMRMVSVLMAAATLYFIFKTMQKLLPENRILQTAVTCAVAFMPTFSFISAMVNNDNLINLLSAILIYLLVEKSVSQDAGTKWSVKTGIVLALFAMTKMTALPLFFVVLTIRIIDLFKAKGSSKRKSVIYSTLIIFAIPLAVAGWWYLRNYMMFGTFFATLKDAVNIDRKMITFFPKLLKYFPEINPAATMKIGLVDFFITKNFFVEYFRNIWGSATSLIKLMTSWQFIGIVIFTILGVAGQIKNLYKNRITKGGLLKRLRDFLASGQGILFLTFVILLTSLAWKMYEMSSLRGYMSAMHGRYFLAAAPALMYMLLRGWEYLAGKKWAGKATAVLIALFVLNDAVSLIHTGPFLFH